MIFIGAEDVEVFEPDDPAEKPIPPGIAIEKMFENPYAFKGLSLSRSASVSLMPIDPSP